MSLINDALKKAQREREGGDAPTKQNIPSVGGSHPRRGNPSQKASFKLVRTLVVGGMVLAVLIAAVGLLLSTLKRVDRAPPPAITEVGVTIRPVDTTVSVPATTPTPSAVPRTAERLDPAPTPVTRIETPVIDPPSNPTAAPTIVASQPMPVPSVTLTPASPTPKAIPATPIAKPVAAVPTPQPVASTSTVKPAPVTPSPKPVAAVPTPKPIAANPAPKPVPAVPSPSPTPVAVAVVDLPVPTPPATSQPVVPTPASVPTPPPAAPASTPVVIPAAPITINVDGAESPTQVIQPLPQQPVSAGVEPAAPAPAPVVTPANQLPDPKIIAFLEVSRITGIKVAGGKSRVLMNNQVFKVGSIVEANSQLKITEIQPNEIQFVDESGVEYRKQFQR